MTTKDSKEFKIVVALLVTSCAALAAGPVSGVIRDVSGAAVTDVTLQLLNSGQAVIASAKADSQGSFQMPEVNPGDYVLLVARLGQVEQRLPVQIRESASELEVVWTNSPGATR